MPPIGRASARIRKADAAFGGCANDYRDTVQRVIPILSYIHSIEMTTHGKPLNLRQTIIYLKNIYMMRFRLFQDDQ
jgi:hypothetical protein